MLLSLAVTLLVVVLCVWLAFWLIDVAASLAPSAPRPSPPRIPLATVCKLIVLAVALYVAVESAFLSHRWLIRA